MSLRPKIDWRGCNNFDIETIACVLLSRLTSWYLFASPHSEASVEYVQAPSHQSPVFADQLVTYGPRVNVCWHKLNCAALLDLRHCIFK